MTSEEVLRLIEQEKLEKTGTLNLREKGLKKMPKELSELTWLTTLSFENNKITRIENLDNLTKLQYLDLDINQITRIENLDNLTNLRSLDFEHNRITRIENLDNLTHLQSLDLAYNEISRIENLNNLNNLQYLNLIGNGITKIENLNSLSNLQGLSLDINQISKIENLSNLTQLQSLDLESNQISTVENLEKLTNLKSLYLDHNQITGIKGLEKLTNLEELNLSSNRITRIDHLENLINLKYLILENNGITDIRPLLPLIKLEKITLEAENKAYQVKLYLDENPIITPSLDIIKQGNQSVLGWFEANKKLLQEIKIILIGEGSAGKTSLLKRLKNNSYQEGEVQTDGINIESIAFGATKTFSKQTALHELTGHFWDFGGQEILSATHRFFLTKRSVYILVLEARKGNKVSNQVREKIEEIKATGGNSDIIVVANKIDLHPGFGFINEQDLQREFPQIKAFLKISCKDKTHSGIETLKEKLAELIPNAELFNTEIDDRWMDIKDQIRQDAKEKHFITEKRFRQICLENQLFEKDQQQNAIDFLNDLGVVLHFPDIDLSEYFVLDPYWISYGVYQIFTSVYAAQQQGKISIKKLPYIINEEEDKERLYRTDHYKKITYSPNEMRFLVDMLQQFKLSYYLENRADFIIPSLLDTREPIDKTASIRHAKNSISFIYAYAYLPDAILPFVLSEAHNIILEHWRNGCIIENFGCQAIVSSNNDRIQIIVSGTPQHRHKLMSILRFLLDKINQKLEVSPKMLIPLPEQLGEVSYQTLLNRQKRGVSTYSIDEPDYYEFEMKDLLDGIKPMDNPQILVESLDLLLKKQETLIQMQEESLAKLDTLELFLDKMLKLVNFQITNSTEIEYPNIFTIQPVPKSRNKKYSAHPNEYELQLYCAHENCFHPVGKPVAFPMPKEILRNIAPYVNNTIKGLQAISIFIAPVANYAANKPYIKASTTAINQLKLLEDPSNIIPYQNKKATLTEMNAIKQMLDLTNKNKNWTTFLNKVINDDGEVLWVCDDHVPEY